MLPEESSTDNKIDHFVFKKLSSLSEASRPVNDIFTEVYAAFDSRNELKHMPLASDMTAKVSIIVPLNHSLLNLIPIFSDPSLTYIQLIN